jgi:hypothetical protein
VDSEEDSVRAWDISDDAVESWRLLSERMSSESNAKLRSNLAIVERHILAEVAGDLDALMATMIPDPNYEFFGQSAYGARQSGHSSVRAMYERANETGRNRREFAISDVVVDQYNVVTGGKLRQATRGSDVVRPMSPCSGEISHNAWYVTEDTAVIIWPINAQGLITGEKVYLADVNHVVRELREGECPHLGPVVRA